jgi:hypothetical protein
MDKAEWRTGKSKWFSVNKWRSRGDYQWQSALIKQEQNAKK